MSAENHIRALLRISRPPNTANPEKIVAENSAWKIRVDVITKLQFSGLMSMQSPRITADLYHHVDEEEQTPDELRKLIEKTEQEGTAVGVLDEEVKKKIESIKVKI